MNNARNQKCMVLILAMIVGIGFVSCGDDDNENTVNEPYTPSDSRSVDLGLSVNWAKMNVGANAPEDCGLFFAWGETKGYTSNISDDHQFDYAEYKWMTAGQSSPYWINKYQVADQWTDGCWFDSNQRFIGDGKKVLELADDAAAANWGGSWRMPTIEECQELISNCTAEWTRQNGIYGCKLTSKKNGNSIFLPASGIRASGGVLTWEGIGVYWSSSLKTTLGGCGFNFSANDGTSMYISINDYSRNTGINIRPVMKK